MREIFKREIESDLVNIEVELDAEDFRKSNRWLFSLFVKQDILDESLESYEELLEAKEALIIALELEDSVKYVGMRIIDGWSELYFYAVDVKQLESTTNSILKGRGFAFESNSVKDPKWNFYDLQLFPTELEFCHIQSAKIIEMLEEEGDNLADVREVEHYVVFDTSTQKDRFVEKALACGFVYKDEISTDNYDHGVALVKKHSVLPEEIETIVKETFALAKEENGYYEGWSTILACGNEA